MLKVAHFAVFIVISGVKIIKFKSSEGIQKNYVNVIND